MIKAKDLTGMRFGRLFIEVSCCKQSVDDFLAWAKRVVAHTVPK